MSTTPRATAAAAVRPVQPADGPGRSLQVRDLSVRFRLPGATVRAVTRVDLDLTPGRCLALVGESGCGKSVLVSALLGLLPANAEVSGHAVLTGAHQEVDLLRASERTLSRQVRGRLVGLVPQSPTAYLTPVHTVRNHLHEVLAAHHGGPSGRWWPIRRARPGPDQERVEVTAGRAGLPSSALDRYPHQLSGGMAQRAVTALALAGDAWLLLADEPTTGLDRALVDGTLAELRRLTDQGSAVLLITHDLDAAARLADDVAVMYAGRVVETGPTDQVLTAPRHPYTRGLLGAQPRHGFHPVPGFPPELSALPPGCAFAVRCPRATSACDQVPRLHPPVDDDRRHAVACHHPC